VVIKNRQYTPFRGRMLMLQAIYQWCRWTFKDWRITI